MKKTVIMSAIAASLVIVAPAAAQDTTTEMQVQVVEKNSRGQAIKVNIGGTVYAVCHGDLTDNCINPRAAGLNWGNRPLEKWPGQPASSM